MIVTSNEKYGTANMSHTGIVTGRVCSSSWIPEDFGWKLCLQARCFSISVV